jgi:hypothetical protein
VIKFVKSRRKAWNEHVGRAEQRLIKLVRDARPNSKRPPGRPLKQLVVVTSWDTLKCTAAKKNRRIRLLEEEEEE